MNRQQRRAGLRPSPADELLGLALAARRAGRLDQAEALGRRALQADPAHFEALGFGAALAVERGRPADALALLDRGLALAPGAVGLHYNRAVAYRLLGRIEESIAAYRAVIRLQPGHLASYNNLARLLHQRGERDAAAALYRRALALGPDPRVLCNLGTLLLEQEKFDEAAGCYERARSLAPDLPDAADTLAHLARARLGADHPAEALESARASLELAETAETRRLFVACARAAPLPANRAGLEALVTRALTENWGQARDLARFATALVVAREVEPATDMLLRALLEAAPIVDRGLERTLTAARGALLASDAEALDFRCALAGQCFLNEYVFAVSDADRRHLAELRAAFDRDATPRVLAALASVMPLRALPDAERLLERAWPAPLAALLARQVAEPLAEQRLAAAMPRLTPVVNTISRAVQAQYEDNPYPRWRDAAAPPAPRALPAHLALLFPARAPGVVNVPAAHDILIAGCGTGQQSIAFARMFPDARVLAIDLSRASLGFAQRQAEALGLTNIEHAQADLLELGGLDRRFELIAANGVLHHLEDPFAGWRALLTLLRPGGVMCVGLYSAFARRDVVTVRKVIAAQGLRATPDGIRACRQMMLDAAEDTALRRLTRSADFASMSGCRDLLFHAQEHRLTLPDIAAFLAENDLDLLGFDLPAAAASRYRARYPDDTAMVDLAQWDAFEREHNQAFANMYQFWVQRRQ